MGELLRVLIVEDSEHDVALILRELRRGGYELLHKQVQTAEQLQSALSESPWDIIISDYSMPQFSGLAALAICNDHSFQPPFILVSGTVGEAEAVQAMRAGAQDYLMKDNLSRLAPAVRRELREAEARRKRLHAEARLGSILDTAADAIIGIDEQYNIVFFNQGAETIFGYATNEALGQPLDLLFPEESDAHRVPAMQQLWASSLRASRLHQQSEVLARRKDGCEFSAEISLAEFVQDDGTYFTVILRDISDRKQAEAALQEANRRALQQYEQLLQRLVKLAQEFGAAPDMLSVYRALAGFVEESAPCNGLFIALYDSESQLRTCVYSGGGGEEDDVSQLPPLPLNDGPQSQALKRADIVVVDDYQSAVAHLAPINLGLDHDPRLPQSSVAVPMSVMGRIYGVFEVQSVEPAAYGEEHVTALRMAANLAAVAIENSRLLQQTQDQARHLQSVIDTVPDAVLLLDAQHRVLLANPVARSYLPLLTTAEEGEVLTHLGDRSLAQLLNPDEASAAAQPEIHLTEPPRVFEVAAQPVARHAAAGWVLVIRDITNERARQEHLQRQDRLATVGQLAAGMAHDFNNVMAIIMLYSDTLSRAPDHPRRMVYLNAIREQSEHAANLISQILDFSRRSVMERVRQDLLPLLKESAKLLRRTMPENITIKILAEDESYICEADPTRVRQLLVNLAINARDAMPNGGEMTLVLANLQVQPGRPPLPEMQPGSWIRLTFRDSGTGIPDEDMPHLFEPFFTTKEPGQGTGLGLAQVYGIVKQHGGEIGVESQLGQGTTFTIYLPAHQEAEADSAPVEESFPSEGGTGETILLVEDDDRTRKAIQETLELLGYQVITADNGLEALITFQDYDGTIDLVLTDMIMPQMGGMAFHRALTEWDPTAKLIVMTGYPLADVGKRALEQGDLTWIQKPFSMRALARILRKSLAS